MTTQPHEKEKLAQLAAEKEQEWRELQALHAQSLEAGLKEKDQVLAEQRQKFQTLKEDFKYNLRLLAERDQELERLEISHDQLRGRLSSQDATISELKIEIDEHKTRRAQDERSMEDLQRHYQQRVREKQVQVEQYKTSKDAELQKERDELEAVRRDMKRRMREVEEELEIQRREMTTGFDDVSRRREKEYRSKIEELSSTVLAHEMKVKLLSKELDIVRGASEQASAELTKTDTKIGDVRKKLKQTEWELNDLRGMKDAEIAELHSKLQFAEQTVERAREEYERKHKELDRYAREREAAVTALKEAHAETEHKLQEEIRRLEGDQEAREVERRREEWEQQDALKDKEMATEKLQQELSDVRGQFDGQLARVSKDMVSKDLVIESLRDREGKLRAEIGGHKEDVERYKKELLHAAEKEQGLERAKAQLELDWQRRYEDAERNQYAKSEDLIARLTKSRNDAVALTKELERELQQKDDLTRVLARDRDHAMATLRKHNIQINRDLVPTRDGVEDSHTRQVEELQAQNESLIAVIRDMKTEMEEMMTTRVNGRAEEKGTERKDWNERMDGTGEKGGRTDEMAGEWKQGSERKSPTLKDIRGVTDGHVPFTEEYVKTLEKECRDLKAERRRLEDRVSAVAQSIPSGGGLAPHHIGGIKVDLSENDAVRTHIQSLNDNIGALRADKVTTSAELRKCQARVSYLETELSHKQHQPKEKQVEVDQLRYELSAQTRHHSAEVTSLTQRIGQLELQLLEAQREAEEYYKGTLNTNLEATNLGQQVSKLTMDLAGRGTSSNNGIQSTLVNQLQREVRNLRSQLARAGAGRHAGELSHDPTGQTKLKTAARHISRLAKERQQLIEMGNRLRSELALHRPPPRNGSSGSRPTAWDSTHRQAWGPVEVQPPGRGPTTVHLQGQGDRERGVTPGHLAQHVATKLENLEKLQYTLTKQELQFARQRIDHDDREADVVQVKLSSSSDSTPDQTPRAEETVQHPRATHHIPEPLHIPTSQHHDPLNEYMRQSQSSEGDAPSSDSSANQRRTPLMMSSLGEESMQDVWRLLDDGASPIFFRSPSPMRKPDQSPIPEEPSPTIPSSHHSHVTRPGLEVAGQGTGLKVRGSKPAKKPQLSAMAAGKVQPKRQSTRPKIRNYALRDDASVT